MVIEFRKTPHTAYPTIIKGTAVEMVDSYKYLETIIDKNLTHDLNTSTICKKGLQRLYFLRSLKSFNVDKTLMVLFYRSFIESVNFLLNLILWKPVGEKQKLSAQNCERRQ